MRVPVRALGALVAANNRRILEADAGLPNPRDLATCDWHASLAALQPTIRAEWDAFVAAEGRTPRIEVVLDEDQGNDGPWRFGLLATRTGTTRLGQRWFPRTLDAIGAVDGLRAAMFSVLEPGTSIGDHRGPNAGVLRYHLGIDCGMDAWLRIGDTLVPYRDGQGVLFDDTTAHAAWNHGPAPRVTLFCEVLRPLPRGLGRINAAVQAVLGAAPRYREAVDRADRWDEVLNPSERRT